MQNYYLGLDVGTNSVGWAVTDEKYNLIKAPVKGRYKNHDMWGIRLFEKASTAEQRRINRSIRRRIQRRKDRIKLLQDIFKEEMQKVDETFFIRLNESRLNEKDRTTESLHPLFNDNNYTDKDYYEEYPTIFHLRKDLIHNTSAHDIRIVYLALHNIIKYRGNFLIEEELSASEQKDIHIAFEKLALSFAQYGYDLSCSNIEMLEEIVLDKRMSKSEKAKRIKDILEVNTEEQNDFDAKKVAKTLGILLVGNSGNIKDIFATIAEEEKELDEEMKKLLSIKFSETKYEESQRDALQSAFPNEIEVIDAIKAFYDWGVFVGIMGEYTYISDAKVDAYKRHQGNLKEVKYLFKKYLPADKYKTFFHSKDDKSKSYAAYVGMNGNKNQPIKKCSEEDFYKELKSLLTCFGEQVEESDREIWQKCVEGAENKDLLPTLRNKDNGSIPRQIHEQELKVILKNASAYLPFFNDVDECYGKSNIEKIISIFEFKIPYYVGPLSNRHKKTDNQRNVGSNVWMQRKEGMENEKIYPWNFDEIVDREKSNEEFILRMTNKCTYIAGEDVLPKHSIIYQKYMVLNELNNLKIRGEKIEVELKQEIYEQLFRKYKKVTGKKLMNYLNKNHNMGLIAGDLTGFDQDFKASLSTEMAFQKIFDCENLTDLQKQMAEDIVRWKTIYGDDRTMTMKVIKKTYPELTKEELKKIQGLPKMSGWGNFSRMFLTQIFCEEMIDQETGEMSSIINALWSTQENLMQLLSNRFGYSKRIDEINAERRNEIDSINYEDCVEGLFTSPSNKRAIWQTLLIAEEVKKIMGCEPKKIFVEMARGGGEKGKRTKSRKEHLKELYKSCEKDVRDWDYYGLMNTLEDTEDRKLNSKKLYLYYLQNGKCAYTGESIDLEELMSSNTKWDIDHIFPQSKIDDDSFDNMVLVKKKENAKKDNGLISSEIQRRMYGIWKYWLEKGFISKKKYSRLTKSTDFTDEELSGFIARQIVETRQSTKLIADVFNQMYKDTKVVYVKANLVSKFRQYPLHVQKSRRINDYHHAKDAYLNIVVGDVYYNKYTDNPYRWIQENRDRQYSITKTMFWDVKNSNGEIVWRGCDKEQYVDDKGKKRNHYLTNDNGEITGGDIDRIREIVKKETCLYTEYTYCEKGQLFNATQQRKHSGSAKIALKKDLNIEEYGGYNSANTSYFALIAFDGKKGQRVKNIVGVPIYIDNTLEHNPNAFKEYCETQLGRTNVVVLKAKIKKNSLISVDGFPLRVRGENEKQNLLKGNLQLRLEEYHAETVRLIEKYLDKNAENEKITVNEHYDRLTEERLAALYDMFVQKFATTYQKRPANQYQTLIDKKEVFESLSLGDKAKVLDQILQMLRCDAATTANLKLLKDGGNKGNIAINKNTLGSSKVCIFHQSVTGLFEKKERL